MLRGLLGTGLGAKCLPSRMASLRASSCITSKRTRRVRRLGGTIMKVRTLALWLLGCAAGGGALLAAKNRSERGQQNGAAAAPILAPPSDVDYKLASLERRVGILQAAQLKASAAPPAITGS